jgi:DNA-binding NarL/FixJ family response regulator
MIRVLLVEDQPAIRSGLRMRLKLEPDVAVIGEPTDGLAALAQTAVLRPDVILLDIESTDMDGVRLVRAMNSA